ncbi:ACC synthase 1 [Striga asiatica]|uniref:ACC synthase 1 n=1 Tax=Striga asiatica TaxID=4170 RepID=A0A5A7P1R5_STRAF|nr:ACC synthase 1 [Striga asiatica]
MRCMRSFSASSSRALIQPPLCSNFRRDLRWRSMPPTIPGTAATVSRSIAWQMWRLYKIHNNRTYPETIPPPWRAIFTGYIGRCHPPIAAHDGPIAALTSGVFFVGVRLWFLGSFFVASYLTTRRAPIPNSEKLVASELGNGVSKSAVCSNV